MDGPPQAGRYRVIYADPPWKFELEIAGDRFAARGSLRAPYDPQALRVKS